MKNDVNLPAELQGGPIQVFITGGRIISLHAVPAGFFVPYQTHCKIRYFTPFISQPALHYKTAPSGKFTCENFRELFTLEMH